MATFLLIKEAEEYSGYTPDHIRWLIRQGFVQGRKVGHIWLVDLEDLQRYESEMEGQGKAKYRPKSLDTTED